MKRNKFNARRTEVDGIVFASASEAKRYSELKLLERAGEITELKLQPEYPIIVGDRPVKIRSGRYKNGYPVKYIADFSYFDITNDAAVVEDSKGMDTPLSRLKRALVEAIYGVEVRIV